MLSSGNWPTPGDRDQARLGLERWLDQAAEAADPADGDFARELAGSPSGRAMLEAIFGNSPFLTQCALREMGFVRSIFDQRSEDSYRALMEDIRARLSGERDQKRLMTGLRQGKRKLALLVALADIGELWPLPQVCEAISAYAELSLQLATRHLVRRALTAGAFEGDADAPEPERHSGLIILGMGKLGARELNYSSDVDLIVFYDAQKVTTTQPDNIGQVFVRMTRDLVRIMEERTADGYVFRTDLRLRPDPGATPIAVSVNAAETYYGSFAQNWERAAMIKARPVAGDLKAGASFLDFLKPFIWRRSLDFNAIQEIHAIKRQIHHQRGHKAIAINGHDIKVGRGGIREIEFFAQTQQLIFGGRQPNLRAARTCDALGALAAAGRVDTGSADDLVVAYAFLRTVEHRLQMINDQQTHSLPETDADIDALGCFLGLPKPDLFRRRLRRTLERVEELYAHLFEEEPTLAAPGGVIFSGVEDDPETLASLSRMGFQDVVAAAGTVRGWLHGRYRSTRSERARSLLIQLLPTLLDALARTQAPDTTLTRFDQFLSRQPAGLQLFSLFYANPDLLDLVAEIFGTSPQLAEHLAHHPELLDGVVTRGFFERLPDGRELESEIRSMLAGAEDYEDVLVNLRRWTNDHRFRAGVRLLRHLAHGVDWAPFLSDVAEIGLRILMERVQAEFGRRHGGFSSGGAAIVAMGKLGSREMSIRSDLDLIVIHDAPNVTDESDGERPLAAGVYFSRLTQRLISAITVPTREGPLYEADMRLRPSGQAGPLSTSLESFSRYQRADAWTWEHMALTRARVIAGPAALRAKIEEIIADVLTAPRDANTLLADVAAMRDRIDKEHHTENPWNIKHFRGGLVDIEFIAQYLQLRFAHEHPQVLSTSAETALIRMADADLLDPATVLDLVEALRLWQRVQAYVRLVYDVPSDADTEAHALRTGLALVVLDESDEPPDLRDAIARVLAVAQTVLGHYERIIADPAEALKAAES